MEERHPLGPRARLIQHGSGALSSAELISVLWGSSAGRGTAVELATGMLLRHGSLRDLSRSDALELAQMDGVGPARASKLAAAFELGRRLAHEAPHGAWRIRAPRDVADRLMLQIAHLEREEMHVLLLTAKNTVLRQVAVYRGNVSAAVVRVAELFRDAVRLHAAGVILAHNHPSGDPEPSADDLRLTAEALAAGRLLDIAVLDHLVIASGGFVSLRDRGLPFGAPTGRQ